MDAFVNVFSWFTAYGQASSSDAMAQGAANLNAVQQMMSESASYSDKASAVSKSSIGLRVVDRVAMHAARNILGLGVLGAEVFSEVSQSTVRGDGNPLAGMQRWLGMSFGVTYGEDHMEFYALVNELIEDWMIPMEPSATQAVDPRNAPRSDAIATRGPTYVDVTPPTSFELQLMVREELSS